MKSQKGTSVRVFKKLSLGGKKIALTFDDGPDSTHTLSLLRFLETQNVPACFFLIAEKVARYAEISLEIHKRGFEIGNHSASHRWGTAFSPFILRQELEASEIIFRKIFRKTPRLYRPPRGILFPWMKTVLAQSHYDLVYWTEMPGDYWPWHSPDSIRQKLLSSVQEKSIWTFHDGLNLWGQGKGFALDLLRELIPYYQDQGYEFVSLREGLEVEVYR
ncbi:MAG: polysaccharide deacetylase family protein [Deltaproteobacteria bacterium]|nr:polysaccharide deacetylase family protein [Deltaproteobacteria bacterium]